VRYRFPFPDDPVPSGVPKATLYRVNIDPNSTGFEIVRKSNNKTMSVVIIIYICHIYNLVKKKII
jgi:hypothetical protein